MRTAEDFSLADLDAAMGQEPPAVSNLHRLRLNPHGLNVLRASAWLNRKAPERRWIVDGILPVGAVTMLNGDGGLGKSLLSLQLACATAMGRPWLGVETSPVKTVGVFCEDDPEELQRRMADVAAHYGATAADLDRISLVSRVGEENTLVEFGRVSAVPKPTNLFHQIIPTRGLADSLGLPKSSRVRIDGGEGEIRHATGAYTSRRL